MSEPAGGRAGCPPGDRRNRRRAVSETLIRLEGVGRTFRSGEVEVNALQEADLAIDRGTTCR